MVSCVPSKYGCSIRKYQKNAIYFSCVKSQVCLNFVSDRYQYLICSTLPFYCFGSDTNTICSLHLLVYTFRPRTVGREPVATQVWFVIIVSRSALLLVKYQNVLVDFFFSFLLNSSTICTKFGTKRQKAMHNSQNELSLVIFVRRFSFLLSPAVCVANFRRREHIS